MHEKLDFKISNDTNGSFVLLKILLFCFFVIHKKFFKSLIFVFLFTFRVMSALQTIAVGVLYENDPIFLISISLNDLRSLQQQMWV